MGDGRRPTTKAAFEKLLDVKKPNGAVGGGGGAGAAGEGGSDWYDAPLFALSVEAKKLSELYEKQKGSKTLLLRGSGREHAQRVADDNAAAAADAADAAAAAAAGGRPPMHPVGAPAGAQYRCQYPGPLCTANPLETRGLLGQNIISTFAALCNHVIIQPCLVRRGTM